MSGRFGRLALDMKGRSFSPRSRMKDGAKMRWGTCDIHRKGDKFHVYAGDRRLQVCDSLKEAKDCALKGTMR